MGRHDLSRFLIVVLIGFMPFLCAQAEEGEDSLPPGMKVQKVGGLNFLIPEDAEVHRAGKSGVITVEDMCEYVARQMEEIKGRLKILDNEYEALQTDVAQIKEELAGLQNKGLVSPDSQNQ